MRVLRIARIAVAACCMACAPPGRCDTDGKQWAKLMQTALPAAFCQEDSAIMRCYDVSQAQCLETAIPVTRDCLAAVDVPDSFAKGEGKVWGQKVGACAGDKLTDLFTLKPGKTELCVLQK